MEKKTRILTVGESVKYHPRIMLTGDWLRNWGLTTGDQVSVTSPEPGTLVIKIETRAAYRFKAKGTKPGEAQLTAEQAQRKYRKLFPTRYGNRPR